MRRNSRYSRGEKWAPKSALRSPTIFKVLAKETEREWPAKQDEKQESVMP